MKNENRNSLGSIAFLTSHAVTVVLSVLTLSLMVPTVSRADSVVFTNFGEAHSYNTGAGNTVGNAFDGNNYAEGGTFTPSLSESFTSLTIALSCLSTCLDNLDVSLTKSAGGVPGAVLENFNVNAASLGVFGTNNAPVILNAVRGPMLTTGTQYWITVESDLNNSIAWNLNSIGDVGATAISLDGGLTWFAPSGQTPGVFEVDGVTVVPEPTSLLLAVPSIIVLFGVWWVRCKATQISSARRSRA
jgi:hypothetical protein